MTRQEALRRARRLGLELSLGSDHVTSPERREAALARQRELAARIRELDEQYRALLDAFNAQPEVRAILDARKALRREATPLMGAGLAYRYEVGRQTGFAFHVMGRGDTWEEAFAQAERVLGPRAKEEQ